MSKPTTDEMLRALEAMYFEWFSNGPEDMPTEGRHKEIYDALRTSLLRLAVLEKAVGEWKERINRYGKWSAMRERERGMIAEEISDFDFGGEEK